MAQRPGEDDIELQAAIDDRPARPAGSIGSVVQGIFVAIAVILATIGLALVVQLWHKDSTTPPATGGGGTGPAGPPGPDGPAGPPGSNGSAGTAAQVVNMSGVVQGFSNDTTLAVLNVGGPLTCAAGNMLSGVVLDTGLLFTPQCTTPTVGGPDMSGPLNNVILNNVNGGDQAPCAAGYIDSCSGVVDDKGRCLTPSCVSVLLNNGTNLAGQNLSCTSLGLWAFPVCVRYDNNGFCVATQCVSFNFTGAIQGPPNATTITPVNSNTTNCGTGDLWSGGNLNAAGQLVGAFCVSPQNTSLNSSAACGPDLTGFFLSSSSSAAADGLDQASIHVPCLRRLVSLLGRTRLGRRATPSQWITRDAYRPSLPMAIPCC